MTAKRRSISSVLALAVLIVVLTGCGNSITTDLGLLVDTTSAAVDIAFPQYGTLLAPYFTDVTTFIDQVSTELATTDTPAQKAAVIAADAAKIAVPNLNGLPATVVTRIGAIAPLIAQIVAEVQQLTSFIDSTPGGAQAFFAARKVTSPSARDIAKLKAKNAALKAKIAALKK
jgi:hypothetical protein